MKLDENYEIKNHEEQNKLIDNFENSEENRIKDNNLVSSNDHEDLPSGVSIESASYMENNPELKINDLTTQNAENINENNNEEYTHNPRIINQNKLYSYFSKTNTINVLDDEIIRIAKGSNLNKPETQFQFHNVLNKKGFFKQIENDEIKKGATIKFENIELEYK